MDHLSDLSVEDFPAYCREHGLRCTVQRMAVFSAIRTSRSHPSVDKTLAAVRKTVPSVTRDSIYRILNEFAKHGLLYRMDALSAARYDTSTRPHAHFFCERCGGITDYPLPEALPLPEAVSGDVHHIDLRITGICPRCKKKGK